MIIKVIRIILRGRGKGKNLLVINLKYISITMFVAFFYRQSRFFLMNNLSHSSGLSQTVIKGEISESVGSLNWVKGTK